MIKMMYKIMPWWLLILHLILGLGFCLYISCFTTTLGGDTLEHMHSSYLVYNGSVPYKDFFQHHNPLLWYIFAPILGLFDKGVSDNFITAFVISMAILASFVTYFYLYLIVKRFISDKMAGLIAGACSLTPYVVLSIDHFRPDNFMFLAFFAGLYHYFSYIEKKNVKDLMIAFVLFWCSFMFLQKIVFTLVVLGIISLYLCYKRVIFLDDMIKAMVMPLILTLVFVLYLCYHDIVYIWYQSNFTFNLLIPELFDERRIGMIWPEFRVLLVCSFLSIVWFVREKNIYFNILAIIFVVEAIQRFFYFSAFAYYFCLLIYVGAMLGAKFLEEVIFKKFYWAIYILCLGLFFVMYKPSVYEGNIGPKKTRFYQPLHREILHYIKQCDYVLNGDGTIYNIYGKDPHYYWNLLGQTDVIGNKVGIHPLMDINNVIKNKKPRIINVKPYKDKYYAERGIDMIVHNPDMYYINKYYKPYNNSEDLYILKPEYYEGCM